jgi:hypothetical protein
MGTARHASLARTPTCVPSTPDLVPLQIVLSLKRRFTRQLDPGWRQLVAETYRAEHQSLFHINIIYIFR